MQVFDQSPTDPAFVQDPYPAYAEARAMGPLVHWKAYGMAAAFGHAEVHALLRDPRFGREVPAELAQKGSPHLAPWTRVEAHSLLEAEPPRHTRLRGLVLRAFTSRRIAALEPFITRLCHDLIDAFPTGPFDLLDAYCTPVPVQVICQLLGVPGHMAPDLLRWSHAMVAMYQANRTVDTETAAARAAQSFSTFLRGYIDDRRKRPGDDLLTRLIAAEEAGDSLSTDELIATCILLLNAGHEATVHSLGNGLKTLLETGQRQITDSALEEILRFDPPLHMFTRYAYEPVTIADHSFQRGDQVALLLAAANRDPRVWKQPDQFDPARAPIAHTSFGGGLHFCVGAPLARLEMRIALPILFERYPNLTLAEPPRYADTYHFHGLTRLMVTR